MADQKPLAFSPRYQIMFFRGTLLKRIALDGGDCVDIVKRPDGAFQFVHRPLGSNDEAAGFESGAYISAETAEAAARLKFKL
jgi:hypothetical protein